MIKTKYKLLSVYHTKANDEYFYFWRKNNAGYTRNLLSAGIYSDRPITGENQYYSSDHNTLITVPVEIDSETFSKLQKEQDGSEVKILNNAYNRSLLNLTNNGVTLKRGN
ncbi:hypothetical protein N6B72_05000 [Chryseobacterium soli]|uniref:hypothetical protein n=1 Tax=Chryseobacterium soli TaxID=445961 RepID=UPI0029530814|nr:hypothetical protein [Chryseobacterium soli]MDV7696274.1 hypothetical protein [Chryseobacterium soli]